jgi:uncharacterized protein (DUF58 family)
VIRPGPLAILGLGLCLVPALAMALLPGAGVWLAAALLAWLAATVVAATRLPRVEHLQVESRVLGTARLGRPVGLALRITNLHFQRLSIDAATHHDAPIQLEPGRFRAVMAPGEQIEVRLELIPMRRGSLDCGGIRACVGGHGWIQRVVDLPLDTSVHVHPAPLSPRLLATLYPGALPDRRQPTPERILYAGLRPFVAGDDARDISWTASARSRSPMVRTWEGPRAGPLVLVVDRGAGMSVAMDTVNSRMDRAVAVASSLLRSLERAGRPVTVAAWSIGLDLWVPPRGRDAAQALAALQPAEHPWDPSALGRTLLPRLRPASTVLIITEPDGEPEALARALASLAPHAAVQVLLVGDPALGRAGVAPVQGLDDAYHYGAVLALEDQRRGAIARWRASGATVVDAGARRSRAAPLQPSAK